MEDLKQMMYTEMVIQETLRLYPSIPIFLREIEKDIQLSKFLCFTNILIVSSLSSSSSYALVSIIAVTRKSIPTHQ